MTDIQPKYYLGYKVWDDVITLHAICKGMSGPAGTVSREDWAISICEEHNENLWQRYRLHKEGILFSVETGDRILGLINDESKFGVVESIVDSDDTYYRVKFDSNWNTNLIEWFMIKGLEKKLKL